MDTITRVAIRRVTETPEAIATGLAEALAAIDAPSLLAPGHKVVIKPNILADQPPEKAVTTDYRLVGAVIDWLLAHGIAKENLLVGESSGGMGREHTRRAFEKSRIAEACDQRGVRWAPFENTTLERVDLPEGEMLSHLHLSQELRAADLIVNMPKIKTHGQMVATLSIKNMFGSLVKSTKPRMHARFPDFSDFGNALVDIFSASRPQLTIMDGIVGLEGNGPGAAGTPVSLGLVLAGTDPVALDATCSRIMDIEPDLVYTTVHAARRGLGTMDLDKIEVDGPPLGELVRPFKIPAVHRLERKLLGWFKGPAAFVMRKFSAPRVSIDASKCTRDAICVRSCPTHALTLVKEEEAHAPVWDKTKCIGCTCCMELCPEGAIEAGLAGIKGVLPYALPVLVFVLVVAALLVRWIWALIFL